MPQFLVVGSGALDDGFERRAGRLACARRAAMAFDLLAAAALRPAALLLVLPRRHRQAVARTSRSRPRVSYRERYALRLPLLAALIVTLLILTNLVVYGYIVELEKI